MLQDSQKPAELACFEFLCLTVHWNHCKCLLDYLKSDSQKISLFNRSVQFPDDPLRWSPGCTKGTCGSRHRKAMRAVTSSGLTICKLMAAALSHVTYIGGIKHVKKPHPYHFSKKKSGLKGILCVAYCWLEVKFNFWREAAARTKLCQSPPKMGLYSDV